MNTTTASPNSEKASKIEVLLKTFWQIDEFRFVGIYMPYEDGRRAWFTELRSLKGDLLYFPENRELDIKQGIASAFIFPDTRLKKGEWYEFSAHINNPNELERNILFVQKQHFKPIVKAVSNRIEREKFIRDLYSRNGKTPSDAKNLANSLRNFQIELYTKTERFIFELLQNADDFPEEGSSVEVNFAALNENILIYHNGRMFSKRDVESICSIGDSSKAKDISATGYKGIGFKSVHVLSSII